MLQRGIEERLPHRTMLATASSATTRERNQMGEQKTNSSMYTHGWISRWSEWLGHLVLGCTTPENSSVDVGYRD